MKREFTCIVCPIGCRLMVINGEISGNKCPRGFEYATSEINSPKRVVTTTVRTTNKDTPVISVKTDCAVPKDLVFKVLKEIKKIVISRTTRIGDILILDVLGTGTNVIATKNVVID